MPYNLLVLQLVSKRNILYLNKQPSLWNMKSFDTLVTISWKMDSRDRFYGFSLLFNIFAEKKTYYAGIMLDAPSIVLCSKLCRHNVSDPNGNAVTGMQWTCMLLLIGSCIWLALWADKMSQILHCDWLPEQARWSYLSHSRLPAVFPQEKIPPKPYSKSFIDHACSVKMARYWPRSFLWLYSLDSFSVHKEQKKMN